MTTPTEKQKETLRKFHIPESEIAQMDFDGARLKLKALITQAQARDSAKKTHAETSTVSETAGKPTQPTRPKDDNTSTPMPAVKTEIELDDKEIQLAKQIVERRVQTMMEIQSRKYKVNIEDLNPDSFVGMEILRQIGVVENSIVMQRNKERNIQKVNERR